jgi:hypothetical protein
VSGRVGGARGAPVATAAFIAGLIAGAVVWSMQIQRSRRGLFSASPVRRLAALGHLAAQPGADTARLLTEYIRWETRPMLRRRAERILSRMQRHLA